MYKTKLLHKNLVDGNAYITINDPYKDPNYQSFRNAKKSDKAPFHVEVSNIRSLSQAIFLFSADVL